jgi:hypothetical protein
MEGHSIFISSCSRRELARRRAAQHVVRIQLVAAAFVLAALLVTFAAAGGWI